MQVNKERANEVTEFMKHVNQEWVTKGVMTKIGAQSDERARFSFYKFLADNNLLQESEERNSDLWIACPFHDDVSPSCSINEQKYVYNCFSCGRHGNLISLIKDYKNEFERSNASYYQVLNDFLRTDKEMQATLGYNNIFSNTADTFKFEEALPKFRFKPPKGEVLPSSYTELADLLIKRKADFKLISLFIVLMQNHVDVKEIYAELYGSGAIVSGNEVTEISSISLDELLQNNTNNDLIDLNNF